MSTDRDRHISEEQRAAQHFYAEQVRARTASGRRYCIVTLGCQMNVRDSETLAGWLEIMGYTATEEKNEADLVLYNTCCVRENAENRALGNVIWLKELKKERPDMLICVCGCMMQEPGVAESLISKYPFIDVIFGTHNEYRFPQLLYQRLTTGQPQWEILSTDGEIVEGLPAKRRSSFMAFVNIMYGCNNFCSYCIVPYVRGRERSREPRDILDEVRQLTESGVKEIMLLGQNVNSYAGGGARFAELLRQVDRLGVERIRFMTSHPKDVSDELIRAFGDVEHLMPQLHLPVQAGNNEVLARMNRHYTREHYLQLVDRLRAVRPDIGLTTDIIVGFPGETEAQFADTLSLVETVRYDAAYTFIYSPRAGTQAARWPDDQPLSAKSERLSRLIARVQAIGQEGLRTQIGQTARVLVENVSARRENEVSGRTPRGHTVNFPGKAEWIGRFATVQVTDAGSNTLRGTCVEAPDEVR